MIVNAGKNVLEMHMWLLERKKVLLKRKEKKSSDRRKKERKHNIKIQNKIKESYPLEWWLVPTPYQWYHLHHSSQKPNKHVSFDFFFSYSFRVGDLKFNNVKRACVCMQKKGKRKKKYIMKEIKRSGLPSWAFSAMSKTCPVSAHSHCSVEPWVAASILPSGDKLRRS